MTTTNGHPLVERYLARLDAAARRLPRGERRELVDEIRAHLDAGIGPDPAEADVRNVLDDLGDPDEIVAAARPATSPTAAPGPNGWVALVLGILSLLVIMVPFAPVVLGGGAVVLGVATRRAPAPPDGATARPRRACSSAPWPRRPESSPSSSCWGSPRRSRPTTACSRYARPDPCRPPRASPHQQGADDALSGPDATGRRRLHTGSPSVGERGAPPAANG